MSTSSVSPGPDKAEGLSEALVFARHAFGGYLRRQVAKHPTDDRELLEVATASLVSIATSLETRPITEVLSREPFLPPKPDAYELTPTERRLAALALSRVNPSKKSPAEMVDLVAAAVNQERGFGG